MGPDAQPSSLPRNLGFEGLRPWSGRASLGLRGGLRATKTHIPPMLLPPGCCSPRMLLPPGCYSPRHSAWSPKEHGSLLLP